MITLPITVTPENMPALDLVWLKIGCRIVWEQGPDRMEIDDTPSHGLVLGQHARLLVSIDALEELTSWAQDCQHPAAPALDLIYSAVEQRAMQAQQDERAATRGQWGRNE